MKPDSTLPLRIAIYACGLLILAFGVALSINCSLGVSPVSSLTYVISEATGIRLGLTVIIVYCSYILAQFLILRRDFRPVNLFQIVFSTLFGYFVDFAKLVLGDFALPGYIGKLAMLAASVVLCGFGVRIYVSAGLIPLPAEGLSLAISKKTGMTFPKVKIISDCTHVAVSVLLSLVFFGGVVGVREGTVLCALLIGKVVEWSEKPVTALTLRLLKKNAPQ